MFDDSEISWHVALTDLVLNDSNYSLTYANFTHFSAEREKEKQRGGSWLYNNVGCDFFSSWKHTHTHTLAVESN